MFVKGYGDLPVVPKPIPHVVIPKPKVMIGRWTDKTSTVPRQCIPDFLHLDPYAGCSTSCTFCSLPMRGHGWLREGGQRIYVVYKDYPEFVREQLSQLRIVHCLDLTASSDAFMALEHEYHYSEQCIRILADMGLPVTVSTKNVVPQAAFAALARNAYSWIQFSIPTLDEWARKRLVPNGASVEAMLRNIEQAKSYGLYVTVRLQPWVHWVSNLKQVQYLIDLGVDHFIMGHLRVPQFRGYKYFNLLRLLSGDEHIQDKYSEKMPGFWVLNTNDRIANLNAVADLVEQAGRSFGVCEEYDTSKPGVYDSLQDDFCTVASCEGRSVPAHVRLNNGSTAFKPLPIELCDGNCLRCNPEKAKAGCRVPEFAITGKFTYADYKRFSKHWE